MSTPIIEHIAAALETAVNNVTEDNGYNHDLTAQRPLSAHLSDTITQTHNVIILQTESEIDHETIGSLQTISRIQNYELTGVVTKSETSTTPFDTECNQIAADIEKAIMADTTLGGYAEHVRVIGSLILRDQALTGIRMSVAVQYTVLNSDPYTNG